MKEEKDKTKPDTGEKGPPEGLPPPSRFLKRKPAEVRAGEVREQALGLPLHPLKSLHMDKWHSSDSEDAAKMRVAVVCAKKKAADATGDRSVHLFRSYEPDSWYSVQDGSHKCKVWEAARATSANESYMNSFKFDDCAEGCSETDVPNIPAELHGAEFVDGGALALRQDGRQGRRSCGR